jgi:hypothetical protein
MTSQPLTRISFFLLLLLATAGLGHRAFAQATPGFNVSDLTGSVTYLGTSLAFGPDDRLYVAQQDGIIQVYTIVRLGPNNYIVTDTETILAINDILNHDDDGTPNPSVDYRQITGIALYGDSANPVIYVTSSDPRIGAGPLGQDLDLDTNSGVISTLTWDGSTWVRQDLVRGLPRSEENHSLNGLVLDTATNLLYVCAGGNTNAGARSNNFALAQEYAYAAAILTVDLNSLGTLPYDLPTLDDEDRAGVNDLNDPFGGNNGKNQAVLEVGGPVQVFSPGFRNPYDIIIAQNGKIYSWDNGPNAGWGGAPTTCADTVVEGGPTYTDGLHYIPGAGYYAGHPNVIRGNRNNTFNASNPQSPVPPALENPVECNFLIPGVEDQTITLYTASSNGLAEYTASNFDSAMTGHLLCAAFDGHVIEVELDSAGTGLGPGGQTSFASGFGSVPLDIIAVGDDGPFPGTVWTANIFGAAGVSVFEPNDYDGGSGGPCDFTSPTGDEDGDGYTNADEIDNGTNPCSGSDKPHDWDLDFISDLNDPDDDNDGIPDLSDALALDSLNGTTIFLPIDYDWEPGDPSRGGFFDLGFFGMMNNGNSDYLNQYNPVDITAGGTAGLFTIDNMTEASAFGPSGFQDNAFQMGINLDTVTRPFVLQTRIRSPFSGGTPQDFQNMGFFFGTGDMDNYIKLVVHSNGGAGGIEFIREVGGSVAPAPTSLIYPAPIVGATFVDLYLTVDPVAATVQPSYSVNGGFQSNLGDPRTYPTSWTDGIMHYGIIGTSAGPGPEFPATWDYIKAYPLGPVPSAKLSINAGNFIGSDAIATGSWVLTNTSSNAGNITQAVIDLSTMILPDLVFDPTSAAGDNFGKDLTVDFGADSTGFLGYAFAGARDGGFDSLILTFDDFEPGELLTFSMDVDPTSIKGLFSPGPNSTGKVSGMEFTGAKVELSFDNGTVVGGQLFDQFGTFGTGLNRFDTDTLDVPSIAFVDSTTVSPSLTGKLEHTIRVSGPAGASIKLLHAEGGMFLRGNPGFDVDTFEANAFISQVELTGTIGLDGFVDIPVTLLQNDLEGGLNFFAAVLDAGIKTSDLSNVLVLQYGIDTVYSEVAINCGGPEYTAADGTVFQADENFFSTSLTFTNNDITEITGTDDDELYKSERFTVNLDYAIPVENGDLEVDLHFAEIFWGAPGAGSGFGASGQRIFNVSAEGNLVVANLDIFDTVGAEAALVLTVPVTVADGELNLDFTASVDQAKISAINIRRPDTAVAVCGVPTNISVMVNTTQALLTWDPVPDALGYVLTGRRLPSTNTRSVNADSNSKVVQPLAPGRSYAFVIRTVCPGDTSLATVEDTFTMATARQESLLDLSLQPNPANGFSVLEFNLESDLERDAEWNVVDLQGRVLLRGHAALMPGANRIVLDLSSLNPGIYRCTINTEGEQYSLPLSILR